MTFSRLRIGSLAALVAAGAIGCQDDGGPEEEQPLQPPPVAIAVTHIKFDHRGGDTDPQDGLNIRKSYAQDLDHAGNGVGEGEWIPSIPRNEPVLWIASTTVTVTVRLTAPANVTSADIEARALGPFKNLVKRNVQFVNGVSQPEYVEFTADAPTPASIKKLTDRWLWKASNVVIQGDPGGKQQISLAGGDQPVWSRDGRELFYRDGARLVAAALRFGSDVSVTARTALFADGFAPSNATNYDVLPDGRGFVMLQPLASTRGLTVMVNSLDELRRRTNAGAPPP